MADSASPLVLLVHPTCSKSASAASLLDDRGVDYSRRDYLAEPLSSSELTALLDALAGAPVELVRSWADRDPATVTAHDVVRHLLAHPDDMQRPVVMRAGRAMIARPPESVLDFVGPAGSGHG